MRGTVYFRSLMTHLGFLGTVYFQREDRIFYAGGTVYFQHLRAVYLSRPYILSRGPYIFSPRAVYFTGDPSQLSKFIQTCQPQPELSNCGETFRLQRNFPNSKKLSNFAFQLQTFQLKTYQILVLSNFTYPKKSPKKSNL